MTRLNSTAARNILLLFALLFCQLAYTQSKTVSVSDPRPVAKAVQMLEAIYDWPITYEDPITVNESLLEDVTEQVRSDPDPTHDPALSHRVIVQKEGTLSFTYKQPATGASPGGGPLQSKAETKAEVANALSSVLEGYANSRGLETFTVTDDGGSFHVFPINFLNDAGNLQHIRPILDTKITIVQKQRSAAGLVNEICQTLSQTTRISVDAVFPINSFTQHITTISGSDVTARSLLSQLLSEMSDPISQDSVIHIPGGETRKWTRIVYKGGPMSWKLFYGPGFGYALNIHKVTPGNQ